MQNAHVSWHSFCVVSSVGRGGGTAPGPEIRGGRGGRCGENAARAFDAPRGRA